jgi:ankyrin repeat protein
MFAMEFVANEIWEQIGAHLDNESYHRLRFSCKNITASILQTITFSIYKAILKPEKQRNLHYVSVQTDHYSNEYMQFLLAHSQFDNILRFLRRKVVSEALISSAWGISSPPSDFLENLYKLTALPPDQLEYCWNLACKLQLKNIVLDLSQKIPKSVLNSGFETVCQFGHLDLVMLFLEWKKVDPGWNNNAAFVQACKNGHEMIVRRLLQDERVDPVDDDQQALFEAMQENHLNILELLLQDQRIDPTMDDNDLFISCCRAGNSEAARLLFDDERVDPSDNFNQAIVDASSNGHEEIVKMLLTDPRVDPSDSTTGFIDDNEALIQACSFGHTEVVRILLADSRVNPSAGEQQPLILACRSGYDAIVEQLLDHPKFEPDINTATAFDESCANDHVEIVQLFLERNLITNSKLKEGMRIAVENNALCLVSFLLAYMDPSLKENYLVKMAIDKNYVEMVQVLFDDYRVKLAGIEGIGEWLESHAAHSISSNESEE